MWLFCLSVFCFVVFFSPTPISAGHVVNVGGWESKAQDDLSAEQRQPSYEVIGPRMRGHEPRGPLRILQPYQLPMFLHAQAPLLDFKLFRPRLGFKRLPSAVKNLLLPPPGSWLGFPMVPVSNPSGVEVWCGYSKISVRVNRRTLGFRCLPSRLFLGSCPVHRFTEDYFYFHNDLNQCGRTIKTENGRLVYSNILHYTPEQQVAVIRAVPLALAIDCTYDRFHYSYKVGYVPEVKMSTFFKSFKSDRTFSLITCNERWEKLDSTESYVLGEPMYFEATAASMSSSERVSLTACHVTLSKDPNYTPRQDVITNYGCMLDSKRVGSRSKFHDYRAGTLRFTIDAFVFPQTTSKLLYLHCSVTAETHSVTPTAKSCTYNSEMARWEELFGTSSACSCCDSQCDFSRIVTRGQLLRPIGQGEELPAEAVEGKETEGLESEAEPVESKAEGSVTKPSEEPVQAHGSQEGGGGGSLQVEGSEGDLLGVEEELLKAEGEPAVWQKDDQGPDQDEEKTEEDGDLEKEGVDTDRGSRRVAGKVLESLIK
ncbi:hypothetical protein AAFF_G00204760 [Aldrovandia affinis]|uniref:Zona pellucida sperm-binding protein 3 n=1 Tax=Aldrovandia affinis TaxID=143900 RepID=A0AAD7RI17_9TELE|nr:hypothetical protein AAFF_G00204760 [Aldrovandia affinis]